MKKLYSASMIAKEVNKSKQWVFWALNKGLIPKPLYDTGGVKGWTESQVNEIKKGGTENEK